MKQPIDIKTSDKLICSLLSVTAIFCYQILYDVIPKFALVFEIFAVELPAMAQAFIMLHWPLGVLCLASIFPLAVWIDNHFIKTNYHSIFKVAAINAIVSFLLLPLCIHAMYTPTLSMGNT